MPPPTIFFSTTTGSNSNHAVCIRRVCTEIGTPNFSRQFKPISCITDNPLEILQQLDSCKKDVASFYFGGDAQHFQALLYTSLSARFGSLSEYLACSCQIDLIFLSSCSRNIFAEALLQAGIKAVVGTSPHLPQGQAAEFATIFYQQFLIYGQTTQAAYNQAINQAGIRPRNPDRQFTELYGNPNLRLRRWWQYPETKPRIFCDPPPPESRIIGEQPSETTTLPSLPENLKPPAVPFPGAQPYCVADARVFFGRDAELTALYTHITTSKVHPIILLYGQAGVGKSSLLRAGLWPRLKELYRRFYFNSREDPHLFAALCQTLQLPDLTTITKQDWATWLSKQRQNPLLVVDQVEIHLLSTDQQMQSDLAQFMKAIYGLVTSPAGSKSPRIIFSIREENLAQFQTLLIQHRLQTKTHYFRLKPLLENDIHRIVSSFTPSSTVATDYQFSLEDRLADRIAADLTQDPGSSIAPYLQAILTSLWREAKGIHRTSQPLSLQRYIQLQQDGGLLRSFLDEQSRKIRGQWSPILNEKKFIDQLADYIFLAKVATGKASVPRHDTQRLTTLLKDFYLLRETKSSQGHNLYIGHKLLEAPITQRFYLLAQQYTRLQQMQDTFRSLTEEIRSRIPLRAPKGNPNLLPLSVGTLLLILLLVFGFGLLRQQIRTELQQLDLRAHIGELSNSQLFLLNPQTTGPISRNFIEYVTGVDPIRPSVDIQFQRIDLLRARDALPAAYEDQAIRALAFSPDGTLLFASGEDNSIETWTVADAQAHPSLQANTSSADLLAINAGGSALTYAGKNGGIGQFSINPWGHLVFPAHTAAIGQIAHKGAITAIQISTDGNLIITSGQDGEIHRYDLTTQQPRAFRSNLPSPISALALHPNEELVAYAGADHIIYLLNLTTKQVVQRLAGHTAKISSLEFSGDGVHLLSAGHDAVIYIWQIISGKEEYRFVESTGAINKARYFPDGILMIAAGDDGLMRLWDINSHQLLATVEAHPDGISTFAIRPDGKQIASAGWNGELTLWDISPLSRILP